MKRLTWVIAAMALLPAAVQAQQRPYTQAPNETATAVATDNSCVVARGEACRNPCDWGACCQLPTITARLGWVYMERASGNSVPIFNDPQGVTLLNADQFNYDLRPGIDASLTYQLSCQWGVDVRYLWVDSFTANQSFDIPAGVSSVLTTPATSFFGVGFGPATFEDVSSLQTVEVNLRRTFGRLNVLCGFRFAEFGDRLSGDYSFPLVGGEGQNWTTHNNLYGIQLGVDGVIWQRGRLSIFGFGKAGVYYNQADATFLQSTRPDNFPATAADSADKAAFLGEVGLYANYQITDALAIRAGYQLLWLGDVAVAANQVPATGNFNVGTASTPFAIDTDGGVFFHGLNVGVELKF